MFVPRMPYQEERKIRDEVREALVDTDTAYYTLLTLHKVIADEEKATLRFKQRAEEWESQCKNRVNELMPAHNRVVRLKALLSNYQATPDELIALHKKRKWLAGLKGHYTWVAQQLQSKGLMAYFTTIVENRDKSILIDYLEEQKEAVERQLEGKKAFQQFADINNKDSLGHWALQQKRPFSLEEESVLMHYKELSTRKPTSSAAQGICLPPTCSWKRRASLNQTTTVFGFI